MITAAIFIATGAAVVAAILIARHLNSPKADDAAETPAPEEAEGAASEEAEEIETPPSE